MSPSSDAKPLNSKQQNLKQPYKPYYRALNDYLIQFWGVPYSDYGVLSPKTFF